MGLYHHVRELWKKPQEGLGALWKERLIAWRQEPATLKLESNNVMIDKIISFLVIILFDVGLRNSKSDVELFF